MAVGEGTPGHQGGDDGYLEQLGQLEQGGGGAGFEHPTTHVEDGPFGFGDQASRLGDERRIALDDGAIVQVNGDILHPRAGDEIWIPANARHRLGSSGPAVRVLEVAFGNWQQADITRYEDDFARPEQGE